MAQRWLGALTLACGLIATTVALASPTDDPARLASVGGRIYGEGMLGKGDALVGTRAGHDPVSGMAAACVNCHRASGMGQVEADILIPPITAPYLFEKHEANRVATMDPRVGKTFNQTHEPYTDASLARALREGINARGQPMSHLMPRYALDDADAAALVTYLHQLSANWSPGVTSARIQLATVITPEVDEARRKVFRDMMQGIVRQKNRSTMVAEKTPNRYHMASAAQMILGIERGWDLQIWELQGAPETWSAQLAQHYREHPVFALVSGLSDTTWQPVQDFCESTRVPCWFPTVPVAGQDRGTYSFYFSGGVGLEARVLASHLAVSAQRPRRVIQVYRDDALGTAAARALRDALKAATPGIALADRSIAADAPAQDALRRLLPTVAAGDTLVLWLREDDIKALDGVGVPAVESYFSGTLAKGEQAPLPASWRAHAHLLYPYQLPDKRRNNLDYFGVWMKLTKTPLIDQPMQSEVFFAMNFLTDMLDEMLDNLYADFLVERAETMLARREATKAEQENRDRVLLGHDGDLVARRGPVTMEESTRVKTIGKNEAFAKSEGTTLYPHLSLGPGQRLASKSAYIVRFAGDSGDEVVAETPLITP